MAVTDGALATVVIPTWNRSRMVAEAVASVVDQSYRNWELIVVDDGSTDDTIRRLESLAIPRLKIIQCAHIGHIGRLRNLGAQAGKGEFIAFLDSDDLWCPAKLERQISALSRSGIGWSYTEYALVSEAGVRIPLRAGKAPAISGHIIRALLMEKTGIPCDTLVVRRPLFDAIGGFCEDPRNPFRDDAEIVLRLARHSEVIAIPETLVLVREHTGRMTCDIAVPNEHSAVVYELFLQHERDADLRALAQRGWARCLAAAGADRFSMGDYEISLSLFWNALIKGGFTGDWIFAVARGARNRLLRTGSGRITPTA
ncbi:MAG TPA: glycosyltransferase family A protein [Rhizomicrobium sp.]|jgi:glycosyltransferase involved in cell wall biosynthesis|nr:glycosyltransferase family A protein [Rhizomicrobium sp.]